MLQSEQKGRIHINWEDGVKGSLKCILILGLALRLILALTGAE